MFKSLHLNADGYRWPDGRDELNERQFALAGHHAAATCLSDQITWRSGRAIADLEPAKCASISDLDHRCRGFFKSTMMESIHHDQATSRFSYPDGPCGTRRRDPGHVLKRNGYGILPAKSAQCPDSVCRRRFTDQVGYDKKSSSTRLGCKFDKSFSVIDRITADSEYLNIVKSYTNIVTSRCQHAGVRERIHRDPNTGRIKSRGCCNIKHDGRRTVEQRTRCKHHRHRSHHRLDTTATDSQRKQR